MLTKDGDSHPLRKSFCLKWGRKWEYWSLIFARKLYRTCLWDLYLFIDYERSLQRCWKRVNHVYSSYKSNYIQMQNKKGYYKMLLHRLFPPLNYWTLSIKSHFSKFWNVCCKNTPGVLSRGTLWKNMKKNKRGKKGAYLWLKFGFPLKFFPWSSVSSKGCQGWRWFVRLEAKDLKGCWRGVGAGPFVGIAEGVNAVCMVHCVFISV